MGAILISLLKQKAAGKFTGLLVSKTGWGVSFAAAGGLWAVLPRALEGDPEAVGQVTLIVLGWLGTLYGRLKAKFASAATAKKKRK